jgi:hypothetical protein
MQPGTQIMTMTMVMLTMMMIQLGVDGSHQVGKEESIGPTVDAMVGAQVGGSHHHGNGAAGETMMRAQTIEIEAIFLRVRVDSAICSTPQKKQNLSNAYWDCPMSMEISKHDVLCCRMAFRDRPA